MVLANLKDRRIADFKSQGMVLCACNEDHSKVKILEPPPDAKNGDRVVFSGVENGDPASRLQMNKKEKLWRSWRLCLRPTTRDWLSAVTVE